jgi:hypothetical protein
MTYTFISVFTSFCTCSFLKSNFTQSASFNIGLTSQFSTQSPWKICPRLIRSHIYYYSFIMSLDKTLIFKLVLEEYKIRIYTGAVPSVGTGSICINH